MSTAVEFTGDPRIRDVRVTEDEIVAQLADGRVISVPLAWSWRLSEATSPQRANFRLVGAGQGIHWPEVDEDISVEGMLYGIPARRPKPKRASPGTGIVRDRKPPNRRKQPTRKRHARG